MDSSGAAVVACAEAEREEERNVFVPERESALCVRLCIYNAV